MLPAAVQHMHPNDLRQGYEGKGKEEGGGGFGKHPIWFLNIAQQYFEHGVCSKHIGCCGRKEKKRLRLSSSINETPCIVLGCPGCGR